MFVCNLFVLRGFVVVREDQVFYELVSHLCTICFASCLSSSREGIVCVVRKPYDLE